MAGEIEAELNIHSELVGVEEVRVEETCPIGGNLPEEVSGELHLEGRCARLKAEGGQQAER